MEYENILNKNIYNLIIRIIIIRKTIHIPSYPPHPPLSLSPIFFMFLLAFSKPITNTYFHFLSIKHVIIKKQKWRSGTYKASFALFYYPKERWLAFITRTACPIARTNFTFSFALGSWSWLGARAQSLLISHDRSWDQKSDKQKNQEVFKVHFC